MVNFNHLSPEASALAMLPSIECLACFKMERWIGYTRANQPVASIAHAQRYFVDIVKATKNKSGIAKSAVDWFAKLYAIEKRLKEEQATMAQIMHTRLTEVNPLLVQFKQ